MKVYTLFCVRTLILRSVPSLSCGFIRAVSRVGSSAFPYTSSSNFSEELPYSVKSISNDGGLQFLDSTSESHLQILVSGIRNGSTEDEILNSLSKNKSFCDIHLSPSLVNNLLYRFEHYWKFALGIFNWATEQSGYEHTSDTYDKMVDILGKAKQIERMWLFLRETRYQHLISLKTMARVMRRLAAAGREEDAIKTFDNLGTYGLEKDTAAMNLLLCTLCKAKMVERAHELFLTLKSNIAPDAYTFNILILGWCNARRVNKAHSTMEEMKEHGISPCTVTYSTILRAYCNLSNFGEVLGLLGEMEAQGCLPDVVIYTTVMYSLAKSRKFQEALQIYERMKWFGCQGDTLFYNTLIDTLGRAGGLQEAVHVFEVEMRREGVIRNTPTYNIMISLFCRYFQGQNALNVLKEMEKSGLCKPDLRTYIPLLKLCFTTGETDSKLSMLLDHMINKHHLSLDFQTYTLLIHGLCRVNKCEKAYLILEEMLGKDIMPRYRTYTFLLDEFKRKNMADAMERVEDLMKKFKSSNQ